MVSRYTKDSHLADQTPSGSLPQKTKEGALDRNTTTIAMEMLGSERGDQPGAVLDRCMQGDCRILTLNIEIHTHAYIYNHVYIDINVFVFLLVFVQCLYVCSYPTICFYTFYMCTHAYFTV